MLQVIQPLLAELGFKKRTGAIFTMELTANVLGWLGLNRATRHRQPGEVEVNPVVGVRHQDVERLVAELRGERYHSYLPPTVSIPLGYLFPEPRYRSWVLAPKGSELTAREMVSAIVEYGIPYMQSTIDLRQLCRELDRKDGFENLLVYRRPVAWFLSGDKLTAGQILEQSLAEIPDRKDAAAIEFRRFGEKLRGRLSIF